jgi:hypothetical protein
MMLAMLLFVLTVLGIGLALVLSVWLAGRRFDEAAPVTRRWARATGAALAVWLATTGLLAASGLLAGWTLRPPPILLLLAGTLTGTVVLAFSPFGTRLLSGLPLAALVGYQASRITVVTNEPANTIVATLPYIWLPTFLVPAALFGHLLEFRYLLRSQEGAKCSQAMLAARSRTEKGFFREG